MNKEILKYFPDKIKSVIEENVEDLNVEEIRIRNNKPIILKASTQEKTIRYYPNSDEMMTILQLICENSIYTYQKQNIFKFNYITHILILPQYFIIP